MRANKKLALHSVGCYYAVQVNKATPQHTPKKKNLELSSPERGYFFCPELSQLTLSDGSEWLGFSPPNQAEASGEVVFTTGMVGYEQSLSDPSYAGQLLVFTYPLVGNYGVGNSTTLESDRVQARGLVTSQHYDGLIDSTRIPLWRWAQDHALPTLWGVDTRALTKHIRAKGAMNGLIHPREMHVSVASTVHIPKVTIAAPRLYNSKYAKTLILVDCGMKESILTQLKQLPVRIKRVPLDYDYSNESIDAVFISNGPGDPASYGQTVQVLKKVMKKEIPVFGICLGSQLLALAAGAKTYKLPYGHRGHNQPCQEVSSRKCIMTSQNHGYAVDERSLPGGWRVSFKNLNDGSVEGIAHTSKPFMAVQFHPESNPGPTDARWLFDVFKEML